MQGFLNQSIRWQLFAIIFIVALPTFGALIFSLESERQAARQRAINDAHKLSDTIAFEEQNQMTGARQLLAVLAQLPEVKTHDSLKLNPILADVLRLNPQYTNISITDKSGSVWASAVPLTQPANQSDKRFFKNAVSSGRFSSGEYTIGNITKKRSFHFALPIWDHYGEIVGVIGCGIDVSGFKNILDRSNLPTNSNFILLDHKGTVITRALETQKYTGKPDDPENLRIMRNGADQDFFINKAKSFDGIKRYTYYHKLRLEGESEPYMYVRAGVPVGEITLAAIKPIIKSMSVLLLALLTACTLAYVISKRSILQKIENFKAAAKSIALGDLNVRFSDSVMGGELGELALAFDETVSKLAESEKERDNNELMIREKNRLLEEEMIERKRSEENIRKSEERYRLLFDSGDNAIFLHEGPIDGFPGKFLEVNKVARERLGYTLEEFRQMSPSDIDGPETVPDIPVLMKKLRDERNISWEGIHVSKDGRRIPVEISNHLFELDGKPTILSSVRDITDRKLAENQLLEINEMFSKAFDFAPTMISISDLDDGTYLDVNQKFLDVSGFSKNEVIGKTSIELGWITESNRELLKENMIGNGKVRELELTLKTKMGQTILCKYWGDIITVAGEKRLLSMALDITEQSKVEQQFLQAQKMESVGRLAGGVAHDFNNLLTVILGGVHLSLMESDLTQSLRGYLMTIQIAAEKSADLTQQLLAFARKQTIAPKVLDINETLTSMLKMLQRLIGEDINLVWQPGTRLWAVKADPSQIDQILANLCVNARDAIAGVGKISIATRNSTIDEQYCNHHADVVPGEYVSLSVSDSGCGMDKETMAHIFEPFFTTKGVAKGTGLGLSMVYGAVKQNNGFIDVNSRPDSGTTFTIYLPRHVGKEKKTLEEELIESPPRGHETILLVEDEPGILDITIMILAKQGYSVLAAGSPDEAIRLAKEHSGEIQLLLTDVVMPGMSGAVLANKLVLLYPGIRTLFMSGYTAEVIDHHGVYDEGIHFIQKPFSLKDLVNKVRDVLDGK